MRFSYKTYFFVIILFFPFVFLFAQNNSKSNLEKKKKKLEQEIQLINQMLKETSVNKKLSISQIIILKKKLEMREELIQTINQELNKINSEIQTTNQTIDALQKDLKKLKAEYVRMLQHAQRKQSSKGLDELLFIFSAQDFYQAYQRLKYIQEYSRYRQKQGREIIAHQQKLQEQIKLLQQQLDEKQKLLEQEEQEKQLLAQEKQEEEQELQQIQKKEKELRVELEKKKKQAQELQLAIKKLIEEEIKRKKEEAEKLAKMKAEKEKEKTMVKEKEKNKSSEKSLVPILSKEAEITGNNFEINKGKLPWPIASGFICANYGEYEHPAIKGFVMFNNGIELCANQPIKVQAVFNGEVTGIALSPMGGKLVIIRHGEYLTVYSNLQEVYVKQGDKIQAKQVIGTVMYNEDENKYSLNFQVWKGQSTLDPKNWLVN
ncbi:MAG: peptidoglycan DD-metalloendopeptidase family protein [Bacteroidia bacterium]|nr:peptidoglycan DD-metalloendopeptidase family protein [Bacteroidia bacterium]